MKYLDCPLFHNIKEDEFVWLLIELNKEKVVINEFTDIQCPFCALSNKIMNKIVYRILIVTLLCSLCSHKILADISIGSSDHPDYAIFAERNDGWNNTYDFKISYSYYPIGSLIAGHRIGFQLYKMNNDGEMIMCGNSVKYFWPEASNVPTEVKLPVSRLIMPK